jgi:hypothetical protein
MASPRWVDPLAYKHLTSAANFAHGMTENYKVAQAAPTQRVRNAVNGLVTVLLCAVRGINAVYEVPAEAAMAKDYWSSLNAFYRRSPPQEAVATLREAAMAVTFVRGIVNCVAGEGGGRPARADGVIPALRGEIVNACDAIVAFDRETLGCRAQVTAAELAEEMECVVALVKALARNIAKLASAYVTDAAAPTDFTQYYHGHVEGHHVWWRMASPSTVRVSIRSDQGSWVYEQPCSTPVWRCEVEDQCTVVIELCGGQPLRLSLEWK